MTPSRSEGIVSSPGWEGDNMGVTLKDVEEDDARRRKQEKRDQEEQEKLAVPPVRLLQVRCPVRCAFVSMI
jgi:hypothetical protein